MLLKLDPRLPARRRCIHCRDFFNSSNAGHRVCPRCRRSYNKRAARYGYMDVIPLSDQMEVHFKSYAVMESSEPSIMASVIEGVLDGDTSVDDSIIYEHLNSGDNEDESFI
jgi:hypothetical protein